MEPKAQFDAQAQAEALVRIQGDLVAIGPKPRQSTSTNPMPPVRVVEFAQELRVVLARELRRVRNEALEEAAKLCEERGQKSQFSEGTAMAMFCAGDIRKAKT